MQNQNQNNRSNQNNNVLVTLAAPSQYDDFDEDFRGKEKRLQDRRQQRREKQQNRWG